MNAQTKRPTILIISTYKDLELVKLKTTFDELFRLETSQLVSLCSKPQKKTRVKRSMNEVNLEKLGKHHILRTKR